MQNAITMSALVAAGLATTSALFNAYIDSRPAADRPDGLTAYWVAAGCAYTTLGASALIGIWSYYLDAGWQTGIGALGLTMAAFAAAGLPMLIGDIRRSHSTRRGRVDTDQIGRILDGNGNGRHA